MSAGARLAGLAALLAWAGQFLATHWPAPSGVPDARADDVRATWRAAARVGRAVGGGHWTSSLEWVPGDKLLHVALFFGVGALAMACAMLGAWSARARGVLVAGLLTLAVVDEWSQLLVGRDAEVWDGAANVAGVALGVAVALCVGWTVRRCVRAGR